MFVSNLTRRTHLCVIKNQFLFFCGAEKLTLRRIHWHKRTTVQPRSCMSPSLWQTTSTPPKKTKTTLVPGRTLKKYTAESQTIPTSRHGKKLRGRERVKLCVYSVAATLFSSGETLCGAFSFCGSPLVAHPCCLQTLLLHVQSDWIQREGLTEDQRFLLLDHWMVDLEK